MKIFLSYGHDDNSPLIERIHEYLSNNHDGSAGHDVWIDNSKIKEGDDWRLKITEGIKQSDVVLAGLSKYSTRNPGVCRNEINISVGVMGGNIKTILLEPADVVAAPAMLSHIQWLDMSDWKNHIDEGFASNYFQHKFQVLSRMIETPENERFNGDINRLKAKLHPISSLSRIQSLTQKRMYGRQWLYKLIEQWNEQNDSRIFWIVGGPGFGKSTFAANLQQTYNAQIPAVQFVEWGKPDHSNPCAILRNLAFQLAVRYHDYMRLILDLPQLNNLLNMNEDELFDILFCESMFLRIDGGHENVWVLIDALDEANDENGNRIAHTIARHLDRLPKWMKFILTSRDDSKVRLPLQEFKPQVSDLEKSVSDNNRSDMVEFIMSELKDFQPTKEQCETIASKSDGVFLFSKLVVDDIKHGIYNINNSLSTLPQDINSYYFALFSRLFNENMSFYEGYVAKTLEIVLASSNAMHISLVKKCTQIESEKTFYNVLDILQHLIRVQDDKLVFFHNSLQNWLVNHEVSGCFYVSRNDGMRQICHSFVNWLVSDDTTYDKMWEGYLFGFHNCFDNNIALPIKFSKNHIQSIINMLCPYGSYGWGGVVRYCYENLGLTKTIIDYIISKDTNGCYTQSFVDGLYEAIKDLYVEIGIVSPSSRSFEWPENDDLRPKGGLIHDTVQKSAFFCALVEHIVMQKNKYLLNITEHLVSSVEILAFYNARLGDILLGEIASLSDMADFTAGEMEERMKKLR